MADATSERDHDRGVSPARTAGCGLVTVVAVVLVIAAVTGTLRSWVDEVAERLPESATAVVALAGTVSVIESSPARTDVLVTIQEVGASGTGRHLARVSFTSSGAREVWRTDQLDATAWRAAAARSGETLFVGLDDELLALEADSGELRWRAVLRDEVTPGCAPCFAVVDGSLVVRTADAHLTAFEPAGPDVVWTRRPVSAQAAISVVGDRLLVVDDAMEPGEPNPVEVLDPASGRVVGSATPVCPPARAGGGPIEIAPGTAVHQVPGGSDAVAAFGFGAACVARWNLDDGSLRWAQPVAGIGTVRTDGVFVDGATLTLPATSGSVPAVDLVEGAVGSLPVPTDQVVAPVVVSGSTLVASTATTGATRTGGLVGWDLESEEQRWSAPAPEGAMAASTDRFFSSDALYPGAPRSLVVRDGDELNLFVFRGDDRTFSVRSLDPTSGALGDARRRGYEAGRDDGVVSMSVEAMTDGRLLLSVEGVLQAIPTSGRGNITAFPDR